MCACGEFLSPLISSSFDPCRQLFFKTVSPGGNSIPGPEVTPVDDGGCDEKMFDLLLLPADFGQSQLFSDR
jgi:hypothetical protein